MIDIFGRVQQLKVLNGKVVITIGYLPITITGFDQDDFTGLYTPRKVVKKKKKKDLLVLCRK